MPLLNDITGFIKTYLPFTPIGRGLLAADEQQQMAQYRNMMMQRQQQEWGTQQQQMQAAQKAFSPGAPHPEQIPVTPQVGSPGYGQVRQQLDQTPTGTANAVDFLKGPQSQIAQALASAGQFGQAGQLLVNNTPQAPSFREETVNGIFGKRNTDTNEFTPFPAAVTAEPKAPQRSTYNKGDEEVTIEWDGQKWNEVARAPRYKAASPQGEQESWGQPVTEAGPDGKPIQVRYGNRGGRQVVEGATPTPRVRAPGAKMIADIGKAGTNYENMTRLLDTWQERYGGQPVMGNVNNWAGRTFGDETGQSQWWQDYQAYINKIRNEQFGSALTQTEKDEFIKAAVTPGMAPSQTQQNLARQQQILRRAAQRQVNPYVAGGYDKEVIEGALGYTVDEINADPSQKKNLLPQGQGVLAPQTQASQQQAAQPDKDGWVTLPNGIRIREKR